MVAMPADAAVALAALMLEAWIGYPRVLLATVGHPVMWIGRLLDVLERDLNEAHRHAVTRRLLGMATVLLVACLAALTGYGIEQIAARFEYGAVLVVIAATMGLAQRSLYEHVHAVLNALQSEDIVAARTAVGRIVGRDTAHLDSQGVACAAIESLAESFNDAIVAPAFWLLLGGLPGLFAYKAINTADSVIGHREERWRMFGWAAARLDDVANLIPARIAGLLLTLAARRGLAIMWRDASKHASPNAGWPEAAMAGGLGVRLGGPASYDGVMRARPYFGEGEYPGSGDLRRALGIYVRACGLLWLLLILVAVVAPTPALPRFAGEGVGTA